MQARPSLRMPGTAADPHPEHGAFSGTETHTVFLQIHFQNLKSSFVLFGKRHVFFFNLC